MASSVVYRFGDYRLDPANRRLQRGDEELALRHKAFRCLLYLVENRDRAVGRDELIERVWGTVNLTDNVVAQTILQARHVLGDTGEIQQFIETVRGFGYRWAAPVEVDETGTTAPSALLRLAPRLRAAWPRLLPVVFLAVLAAVAIYLRRGSESDGAGGATPYTSDGDIAFLLPVTVEASDRHAWIRLGLREVIAERLRAASQAMVPSETVIALASGLAPQPTPDEIAQLAETARARLVLVARAQDNGTSWRVSVRTVHGVQPPLSAFGETEDVLEAARTAADRMALSLGLTPAPEPTNESEVEPGLALLMRQVDAAILAQQSQVARDLLEAAPPELRDRPEVRLQMARLDFYGHRLDTAEAAIEALLGDPRVERDPLLRSRALTSLGAVRAALGDYDSASRLLHEAVDLATRENRLDNVAPMYNNLSLMALTRGDLDAAWNYMALARGPLEGTGDIQSLAILEANLGVLEALRDRWAAALVHFESSARRHAALNNLGYELQARASALHSRLILLDPDAAGAMEPRIDELLAQTDNPDITTYARLSRAHLLSATGRLRAAEALLAEVLQVTDGRDDLRKYRLDALSLLATHAANEDDWARAAHLAAEVVDQTPRDNALHAELLARSWLILTRAELARRRPASAAETVADLNDWAEAGVTTAPPIYAALARAELAAAEGRTDSARIAFEHAFDLADAGQAPRRLLEVAQAYVPWLLATEPSELDSERARIIVGRVAGYAERCYEAALLQLRLYHATGPLSAWRAALDRVSSLAGERSIPPELTNAPGTVASR